MQPRIALITVLTDDVPTMVAFYRDVLGFATQGEPEGPYVEFVASGVRFSICARSVMAEATNDPSYRQPRQGQTFELAFPCDDPADVDASYAKLVAAGACGVTPPATMPWGQRTAFFADPDGNIAEIFSDVAAEPTGAPANDHA